MGLALKENTVSSHDLVETVNANGSYSMLAAAIKAGGLVETLKGNGPFTIFAPSDDAFKKLPGGALENLLKTENQAELVRILKYHAVAGRVTSADLKGKKFSRKSVEGAELAFDGTTGVTVNKHNVSTPDIQASNGVIHGIDSVLMPPKS